MAARLARICAPGDAILLIGDLGAGKTAFAQGFAAALGVEGPVTSPTFALVRQYRCRDAGAVETLIHADVYRTGTIAEVVELALAELVEEGAIALIEWGDLAAAALGDDALEITFTLPDAADDPADDAALSTPHAHHQRPGPLDRAGRRGRPRPGPHRRAGGAVNIVAIETATETVGVAVRTESGTEAAFTLRGRRRHVETLAPAMEHLFGQLDLAPTDLDVVAVDLGPGLFTGLRVGVAAAKGLAQALGIGVVGLSSLDILTRAAVERGHDGPPPGCRRRPAGEVFASVRELRAGGAPTEDVIGAGLFSPEELAAALSKLEGVRIVGVGDGAQRYAAVLGAGARRVVPHGRARLAPATDPPGHGRRALRRRHAGARPRTWSCPSTCGRPTPRATSPRPPAPEPAVMVELRIEKLKRRDLRHLLPIEAAVFPEPWSVGVFNSELALRHGRLYRAAWHGDDMAGYIGFMIVDEEAHMTTIATAPAYQRQGVARTLLIDGIHTLLPMGVRHLSLEVAASNEAGADALPAVRLRPGGGAQEATTRSPARTRW